LWQEIGAYGLLILSRELGLLQQLFTRTKLDPVASSSNQALSSSVSFVSGFVSAERERAREKIRNSSGQISFLSNGKADVEDS
jgi:hypothetical protein